MKNRIVPVVASLLLALLFILGLENPASAAEKTVLTFAWDKNVAPNNPHMYMPNQLFAQAMSYEGLVRVGSSGKIEPCLARSWEIREGGKTFIFFLRSGVKFADGSAFGAGAVVKNFDAIMRNKTRHDWVGLTSRIASWKAVNDSTFELRLKKPYAATLQDLALVRPYRFLAPSAFPPDGKTNESIKAPTGTGPWVLAESRKGEFDRFVRNEHYWGKKPFFKEILIKVIPEAQSRAVALETGAVDLILSAGTTAGGGSVSTEEFARMRAEDRTFATYISGPRNTLGFVLNSKTFPTNELAVRQAIQHAVDSDAIVKHVLLGIEKPAHTMFSKGTPYCNVSLATYAFDRKKADAILTKAGWKIPKGKTYRERDGKALELDIHFVGNNIWQKNVAEAIQGDLRKAGIKAVLVADEANIFFNIGKDANFNMAFYETLSIPYDPLASLSIMKDTVSAINGATMGLPMKAEFDALVDRTLDSYKEEDIASGVKKLLAIIQEQAVYLPISVNVDIAVHKRGTLKGIRFMSLRNEIDFASIKPGDEK